MPRRSVALASTLSFVASVALAALPACGEIGDTVIGVAADGGASPYPLYTPDQVATGLQTCQQITGSVVQVSSVAQELSLLAGSWLSCPSSSSDAGSSSPSISEPGTNVDGIQFTRDGEFRYLVLDPAGNLTSGVSPITLQAGEMLVPSSTVDGGADGARISYSVAGSGQIDVGFADRSTLVTFATFESTPRRLTDSFGDAYVYMGP